VFEIFAETGSGVETVRRLRDEGLTSKSGRLLNKGEILSAKSGERQSKPSHVRCS
jgi:hypothetical protein